MQTIIRPSRDNKPYRLRCRFKIEPYPRMERLDREKVNVAERFVKDMHQQGWENDGRFGFKMTGPFPTVSPVTVRMPRIPTAKEMLPYVLNGARFLDKGEDTAQLVVPLMESESWEYELSGVFIRQQMMSEVPDLHEEER